MAEILISRYEEFTANKYVTYITTNLFASEIEKQFGKRLLSRMRNMFNHITFSPNSSDKMLNNN